MNNEHINWLEKAADNGIKEAQEKLAGIYEKKEETITKAYDLYKRCNKTEKIQELRNIIDIIEKANSGDPESKYKLWEEYQRVDGVLSSDATRKQELLRQSAEGDYGLAQYHYALTFKGKDNVKYINWLQKAADNGIKEAQEKLAGIYEKKEETITKAYDLYKRCNKTEKIQELRNIIDIIEKANSGDPESKYKLWEEYQRVDGVLSSNATREQELLRQSAEGDYGLAQYHYALTFKGKDNVKYINWLQKAADRGIGKAREELTGYYETEKTNRSKAAARKWQFLILSVVVLGVIIFVVAQVAPVLVFGFSVVGGLLGFIFSPVGLIIIGIIIIIKLLSG